MQIPLWVRIDEQEDHVPRFGNGQETEPLRPRSIEDPPTRRINGREVHAGLGESLTSDMEILQNLRKLKLEWDDEFLADLCKRQGYNAMAQLVRAEAIK